MPNIEKYALTAVVAAAATFAGAAVLAQDGAELYASKTCVACHGKDGNTPLMPEYPKIAGQNAAYAIQQMRDIKSGERANANSPAMAGIMHMVSDEEIVAIAEYLESL
jgi:cytochrome c